MQKDNLNPDLIPDNGPCGQEFHYVIDIDYSSEGGKIFVTVFSGPMTAFGCGGEYCNNMIFLGNVESYGSFIESETE